MQAQDDGLERRLVRGLEFVGNRAIDDYSLSISIATSNSSWAARFGLVRWLGMGQKRYFDERDFRIDVLRIRLLYNQRGYLDAQVDTLVRRGDDDVSVRFVIREGEPVRVTSLGVTGIEDVPSMGSVLRDLPLAEGDPFDRFRLQQSADSLRAALQNRGFPFAQVFRNFDMNRERREATVSFDVFPGTRARIAEVSVVGAREIGEDVIRRMIPIRAGSVFRMEDLFESQRELYRVGVFNYVTVRLVDSVPESPDDSLVSVAVTLAEGDLSRIRLGAGYGSIDCFRGLAGWTASNFIGGARTLDVTARVSKIGAGDPFTWGLDQNVCFGLKDETESARLDLNYAVTATLQEPHLFSRRRSGSFTVFGEKVSELNAYVRTAVGGELAVTQQIRRNLPVRLTYQLQVARTRADLATFCTFLNVCRGEDLVFTDRLRRSTLGLRVVRDRANSTLDPTRGNRASAEVRWASTIIGSDSLVQFMRGVGEIAGYHRVGRRGVFAWRIRMGGLVPPTLSLSGQSVQFVPPDERFYGGGPNSVRGFGQNQLGPLVRVLEGAPPGDSVLVVDSLGVQQNLPGRLRTSPTGGNTLYLANAELRFPLPVFSGRLSGALFVDAGQVFQRGDALVKFGDVRFTPGAGVRLASPLGPVRLDVAYNAYDETPGLLYQAVGSELREIGTVSPVRGTGLFERVQLHFSVGQAF